MIFVLFDNGYNGAILREGVMIAIGIISNILSYTHTWRLAILPEGRRNPLFLSIRLVLPPSSSSCCTSRLDIKKTSTPRVRLQPAGRLSGSGGFFTRLRSRIRRRDIIRRHSLDWDRHHSQLSEIFIGGKEEEHTILSEIQQVTVCLLRHGAKFL